MSQSSVLREKSGQEVPDSASEGELYGNEGQEYGGEQEFPEMDRLEEKSVEEFHGEYGERDWEKLGEDYGEGKKLYIFGGEATEYPSVWGEYEGSIESVTAVPTADVEVEETEEEKELRREREALVDNIKHKIIERLLLRRRNAFLQKKLVEHFKKRRMENVLKEEPKGLDLENKYLKKLYAFKEFKQAQEAEIEELTRMTKEYEAKTNMLEEELEEKLKAFMTRAKEVSLNLILSKTGKKINEKTVDRLLRRQTQKNAEKGRRKLKYIKIKKLIEEKELQLKVMQYFGDGLHLADYEQMKIDNQNYTDKIEEKEEELSKLREKTQGMIQNLANVREKAFALEGDIELMEEKVYAVENTLAETRERLTNARRKRDHLREEFGRLKSVSGLLTKSELLRDFEMTINQTNALHRNLTSLKKSMNEKNKQETELAKMVVDKSSDLVPPWKMRLLPKGSPSWRR